MDWEFLYYLLYGFVSGLGELLPVSPAAHGYLLEVLTRFEATQPALLLSIHLGCFLAVCLQYHRRVGHMYRELKIARLPLDKRKRPVDTIAVLDAKVLSVGAVPLLLAVVFSAVAYNKLAILPLLSLVLVLGGVVLYIPQFLPGANKDSRALSQKDSILLGLAGAAGVIPGMSRMGTMISVGLIRGCDRSYILDIAMLASLPVLLGLMVVDGVMLLMSGTALTGMMLLYCALAAAAALGGAWLAMVIMRFLSVKSNFYGFAYFNWGLGLFSFLVYLMI